MFVGKVVGVAVGLVVGAFVGASVGVEVAVGGRVPEIVGCNDLVGLPVG